MAVESTIVYIKGNKNTEVQNTKVKIGDVLEVSCSNESILTKIKSINLLKIPEQGKHRYVVSIMKVIEKIQDTCPHVEIQNMGETDLIITYEGDKKKNLVWQGTKVGMVFSITFVGAAFSIMTFNNDVDVPKLFSQIYEQVMGTPKTNFSVLELTYSLGISVGILVFFNHFGKKRFTVDPTPIEVEMRSYEDEIQNAIIKKYEREGQEESVS